MTIEAEVSTKTPGKVRNRTVLGRTRAVVVKFDPPNSWSDGSTDDWSVDEVAHYEIYIYRNGVLYEQDLQVKSLRKSFPIPKADSSGTWSAKVRAIGRDEQYAAEDAATGSAVPESAGAESFSELTGTISHSQTGSLGISRYGSSAPSPAKQGDIWIDTSTSPPEVKQYDGGSWSGAKTAQTVLANSIVTGALDAYTINSARISLSSDSNAYFRSGPVSGGVSGNVVVDISGGEIDRVKWRDSNTGTLRGYIMANALGELQLIGSANVYIQPSLSVQGLIDAGGIVRGSRLQAGDISTTPPAGYVNIYKGTGNTMNVRFPDGTIKSVNLT